MLYREQKPQCFRVKSVRVLPRILNVGGGGGEGRDPFPKKNMPFLKKNTLFTSKNHTLILLLWHFFSLLNFLGKILKPLRDRFPPSSIIHVLFYSPGAVQKTFKFSQPT